MELAQGDLNVDNITAANLGIGICLDDDRAALSVGSVEVEVSVYQSFSAEHLNYADNCLCGSPSAVVVIVLTVDANVIGTNTEHDLVLAVHILRGDLISLNILNVDISATIKRKANVVARLGNGTVEEVHLRCADKSRNEHIVGVLIKVYRGIDLLNEAVLHNYDTRAHGHSFYLVVCNVDKGRAELLVQTGDLRSHCRTKLCVKVGERLVEKKYLRLTNDSTSERNSLTLTARKSLGLSLEILSDAEDLCRFHYFFVDLIVGHMNRAQRERHVLIYAHVRIKSIVLEYHCDVSVLGFKIVNYLVIDTKLTRSYLLKSRDHTKRGGLTTTRRTDEYDKFLVVNVHTEVVNCLYASVVYFENMF